MALTISRTDIVSNRIVEYSKDSSFLKLPIRPYLELLKVDPIPSQMAIVNAINNPKYRFVTAAISRRQGKTYIANIIGQMVSLVPGCNILIMSPNYSLSQISFELQRSLIKHFELEVDRDNAKDKVIILSNGSSVRMGSVNQVDSCVGRSYDLIIFDEAALSNDGKDAFNVALRPTLDKENSKALFISTPRGKNNWFSEFYERGFSSEFPEWVSIKATYHDNPRMSARDVEEARKSMSEAEFRQEYEADFNIYEGQIWNLDPSCVQDLSDLDTSDMDIICGLDIGFKDPTALVVLAYEWSTDTFYAIDEYKDNELTTAKQAENIREKTEFWGADFIFIDSAAAQTRFDFAQEYDISTTKAKKSVEDGIGKVASIIDNNKLIVSDKCKYLLAAIDQYQWDTRPGLLKEKPKHNDASHMADALRYVLYSYQTGSMIT